MKMSPLILFCAECGAANNAGAASCAACQHPFQSSSSVLAARPTPKLSLDTLSENSTPVALLNSRYEIVREIGQGGYSVVYMAKDTRRKNRRVAIKQINLGSLSPRQVIEATDTFNRELKLLNSLKHRSLPRIYEHFTDPDHWYLVMEYIEGETLEDYTHKTRQRPLSVKEVIALGIQLCKVLNMLHRQDPPIIFRDVKPANIMRTPKGRLYLIDFGIARRFSPEKHKDTQPLGSPGYAPPEQYGRAQTTVQSDIYSLGATLSELLTGNDPLDTSTSNASAVSQPIPPKLRQLLDTMLEHDTSKRPKNVKEVQWQLRRIRYGVWDRVFSFLRGFLLTSLPYPVLLLLSSVGTLLHIQGGTFLPRLYILLFDSLLLAWPFLVVRHLIVGIRYLWLPSKRWMGLGMLSMLVVFAIGAIASWPLLALVWFLIRKMI